MITGEMYDNHDLHWSVRQQYISVQPQLLLLTTQSKLFTNSRTIMGMEDSQQERHCAEDKIRLRKSSDVFAAAPNCWHRGSGHKKLPYPVIQSFSESRTMDVRWVSMQMHLSLIMPNPGHATLATFPNFRWLLCGQVLEARKL